MLQNARLQHSIGLLKVFAAFTLSLSCLVVAAQDVDWKTLNRHAETLYGQGKYGQAVIVAKQAFSVAEKTVGPNHPDVATSLNILALLYKTQGEYVQAEPLYKRALAISSNLV